MLQREFNKLEELVMQLKAYIHTEIELVKLTLAEKISKLFSSLAAIILVGVFFLLFILFGSFAMAYLIGEWLGKISFGFLIMAALYLLATIITWLAREKLIRTPIMNAIIRQLFKKEEQDLK